MAHRISFTSLHNLCVQEMGIQQDLSSTMAIHSENATTLSDPDQRGIALRSVFERTGNIPHLDEAISLERQAIQLSRDDDPTLPWRLDQLGISLWLHSERTGSLDDIAEAISTQKKAVSLTPEDNPGLPGFLTNLGISSQSTYERTGKLEHLDGAISATRRAVELVSEDNPYLSRILSNLGGSLMCRFDASGDPADITEAISAQQRSIRLTTERHSDLPGSHNNLGNALHSRFERTGDLADIHDAISEYQIAVQLTPPGHPDLAGRLNNWGMALQRRFELRANLSDIDQAISMLQKALDLTANGHPNLPSFLNNLSTSLLRRFESSGDLTDIAEAISASQKAMASTPEGHPLLPLMLINLGNAFLFRFERTGDLSDISEVISAQRRAVDLTPDGHPHLPGFLTNLGSSLQSRFERTADVYDIDEAISVHQKAVSLTLENHPSLPAMLTNLANSCGRRFESGSRTREMADNMTAVSAMEKAVELTPEGHPERPGRLNSLGNAFLRRFDHRGDLQDIGQAVSAHERAVECIPEGHSARIAMLSSLGGSLHSRSVSTGCREDLEESISRYKLAANGDTGSVRLRLKAATSWTALLFRYHPHSPEIISAVDTTIRLFALTPGLEQTVQQRYAQIKEVSNIVAEAAGSAFSLGRADKALEWLEEGRCLVWSQLTRLRTPMDELRAQDAGLAQNLEDVSKRLEAIGSKRVSVKATMLVEEKMSLEDEARGQLGLAKDLEELLCTARAIPGFESFLLPPSCSDLLQSLPEEGPVVIVNVHERRCDAIALVQGLDEPMHIALPNLTLDKVTAYRADLKKQLSAEGLRSRGTSDRSDGGYEEDGDEENDSNRRGSGRALKRFRRKQVEENRVVGNVLRDLWTDLVKPVLDALAISKHDTSSKGLPPRIWWCPTGPLTFLPICAAGIYDGLASESILDYAVSSYIPTVSSLTNTRAKEDHHTDGTVSRLFLTSQPNAPGVSAIPGTTKEAAMIHAKAAEHCVEVLKLDGDAVTVGQCLQHMEEYSNIHLACHASQNASHPLQSRFLFHNGSLDLRTIIQRNLENADFAFLSACQTSTGDENLTDEAVHLAAGMLAAGYRRVVATMWAIGDEGAVGVAGDFYEYLWREESGKWKGNRGRRESAYAIHYAVGRMRARLGASERALLAWVPYVHFGL